MGRNTRNVGREKRDDNSEMTKERQDIMKRDDKSEMIKERQEMMEEGQR